MTNINQDGIWLDNLEELSAKKIFDGFFGGVRKKFGQNFLFDEKINRKIVSVAGDLTGKVVAEVGPGPGGLTLEILKQDIKKLYVIELDPHWSEVWRNLARLFNGKLEVIEQDALGFCFKNISPHAIISNLPYNISTQLLFKWLEEFHLYECLVLTFQKEVADRLRAKPSTKAYGKLSVLTQWKSRVSKAFDLKAGAFFPAPEVKSTAMKFIPYGANDMYANFNLFSNLLTAAFQHPRKVVIKSLSKFLQNPEDSLLKLGYGKNARAGEIALDDYIEILSEFLRTRNL
ncbi:MAG: 16S rRNA (adenine(1518)-N(6)/adenine(1519)-N(6))-dimethyltransferase RsmA [Holosporaceae bacterium]|nr:16S rRNA (adenine(1518)-N(6)/adenine(1519)-N(6))-dimethyltransferase RsmA [Holosporaceae bacterium]